MGSSQKVAAQIEDAQSITMTSWADSCQECENICWTIQVWAHGGSATGNYKTCLLMREHLAQGLAIQALGRWLMGNGTLVQDRENARWLLEHQPALW